MGFRNIFAITLNLLSWVGYSVQQSNGLGATANFSSYFNATSFPQIQQTNVSRYLFEAQQMAGSDLYIHFKHRCTTAQLYSTLANYEEADGFVNPFRPFNSVFFVGQAWVSSWAIDTGDGLILIDTLDNGDEVQKILLPGIASFGYKPQDIKAIIITHEHADHYGGAGYLQQHYNIPIYASDIAWANITNPSYGPKGLLLPKKNMTLYDNQKVTVGNTTIDVYWTPGHTPGCMSLMFPVQDRLSNHTAGLFCGGGIPTSAAWKDDHIRSFSKFAALAEVHGADVLMSNHQTQDNTLNNADILANRECTAWTCNQNNPYIIGTDAYIRYLKTMQLCIRVQAARLGQDLSI